MKPLNVIKTIGFWITLLSIVVGVAALIVQFINGGTGYFENRNDPFSIVFTIIGIVLVLLSVIIAMAKTKTEGSSVAINLASGIVKIVGIAFVVVGMVMFLSTRMEGLGFIYGSDESTKGEVQTPVNMASAAGAIVCVVLYVVSWISGIVSLFFSMRKVEVEESQENNGEATAA